MSNNKSQSQGVDFIGPLVEITHHFAVLIGTWGLDILKYAWPRYNKLPQELKRIDIKEARVKKVTDDSLMLGHSCNRKRPLPLKEINFAAHTYIVGAAGSGKTNLLSVLQENHMMNNVPVIFLDPKADMESLLTFEHLCKKYNRTCYIFHENYKDSIVLNPLKDGTVNLIVDRIMNSFKFEKEFYKITSEQAIRATVTKLKETRSEVTFDLIYEYMIVNHNNENTIGMIGHLERIVKSDFAHLLKERDGVNTKSIREIRKEKACLYIGLSTQGYGEIAKALAKIFVEEMLYVSYLQLGTTYDSHYSMNNPLAIYFDEFGAIATPRFLELQNKCRGAGMQLFMAMQSPNDIKLIDENLTGLLIENSANIFVFKQRFDETSNMLAKTLGTIIGKKQTYQTEDGSQGNRGSERDVNEFICHPDIIKNLKRGQCVLLQHDPTRVDLINVRNRRAEFIPKQEIITEAVEVKIELGAVVNSSPVGEKINRSEVI
ncbi:MAG: TraM recognition domain-containing protein [Bacteriovorax sp.]|nr:TraM recognition domain-containing protein [Bacteriovorax sp.]